MNLSQRALIKNLLLGVTQVSSNQLSHNAHCQFLDKQKNVLCELTRELHGYRSKATGTTCMIGRLLHFYKYMHKFRYILDFLSIEQTFVAKCAIDPRHLQRIGIRTSDFHRGPLHH